MLKPSLAPLIDQTMSVPAAAGSGSLKLTPVAVPVPALLTVTVKLAVPPALTVGVEVVLLMSTSGAVMLTVAEALWFCSAVVSFVALTVAVLTSVPVKLLGASAALTVPVRVTVWLSPAASVVGLNTRLCPPGPAPLMLKSFPASCVLIDQVMSLSAPAGSGSLKLTPVAVPVPALLTVTVKLAVPPALTVGVEVLLVMSTSGAVMFTVAEALWFCSAVVSLPAVTVAVLTSVPVKLVGASAALTGPVRVTVWLSPAASVVGLNTRLWPPGPAPLMLKSFPASCVLIDQVMSLPGSGSLKLTPVAVPVPSLLTVTVKLAVPPALTVGVEVLLVMSTSGAVMLRGALALWFCSAGGSLAAVTVAVLATRPGQLGGAAA